MPVRDQSFSDMAARRLRPVRVAILDTGVNACHPLLRGRCETDGDDDVAGHGTSVAGIVARLAPNAIIVSRRVLGEDFMGDGDDVMMALEYAIDSPAEIVNLSVTIDPCRHSQRFERLMKRAEERGKIIVAAGDNMPAKADDVGFPAAHPQVLGVGGGGACSTWRISKPSSGILQLAARSENLLTAHFHGGYCRVRGTSFATPIVTAGCALLMGSGFDGDIVSWRKRLTSCSARQPIAEDPLEVAPDHCGEGDYTLPCTCPSCGARQRANDAFMFVHCCNCHRTWKRDVLLDPRDIIGVLAYVRENQRFDRRLPLVKDIQADIRNAFASIEKNTSSTVCRRRLEVYTALLHRLPNWHLILDRLALSTKLQNEIARELLMRKRRGLYDMHGNVLFEKSSCGPQDRCRLVRLPAEI